jgi:hypothetical protein
VFPAGFLHFQTVMSILRHLFQFAVRWSSGEVEGAQVQARSFEAAEARLQEQLQARADWDRSLGRPRIVAPCLLSRLELDHVELDWKRAS